MLLDINVQARITICTIRRYCYDNFMSSMIHISKDPTSVNSFGSSTYILTILSRSTIHI